MHIQLGAPARVKMHTLAFVTVRHLRRIGIQRQRHLRRGKHSSFLKPLSDQLKVARRMQPTGHSEVTTGSRRLARCVSRG